MSEFITNYLNSINVEEEIKKNQVNDLNFVCNSL